jgi:hypothetical protein
VLKAIRIVALIAILVGCFCSLRAGRRLQELRQDNRELRDRTGDLQIGDPQQVHIVAFRDGTHASGIDAGIVHLWNFRLYYPAGYQPNHFVRSSQVSADSPRAQSSGSSSYHNTPLKEPQIDTLTLSITKSDHGWRLSRLSDESSGATNVAVEVDLADTDNLVIEPVVRPGDGAVSFPVDEPICLLRVREQDPVKQRRKTAGDEPLYRGFYYYLVPFESRESFEAQMRGKAGP